MFVSDNINTDVQFGQFPEGTRSRCWMILCYPDDPSLNEVLTVNLPSSGIDYCGRCHDMEGKLHHHVVLSFHNPRNAKGISDELQLSPRWLRPWDRKVKAFRYLCHKDNPEKYQYDIDGLYGPLTDEAIKACASSSAESETSDVQQIIELLNSIDSFIRLTDFVSLVASKGLWSTFRRMGSVGSWLVDEHNTAISNKRADDECRRDIDRFRAFMSSGKSKEIDFETWCDIMYKKDIY